MLLKLQRCALGTAVGNKKNYKLKSNILNFLYNIHITIMIVLIVVNYTTNHMMNTEECTYLTKDVFPIRTIVCEKQ